MPLDKSAVFFNVTVVYRSALDGHVMRARWKDVSESVLQNILVAALRLEGLATIEVEKAAE